MDKLLNLAVRYCEEVGKRAALTLTLSPRERGSRYLNGGLILDPSRIDLTLAQLVLGRSFGTPVLSGRRKSPP
jgi:hypothetical protein